MPLFACLLGLALGCSGDAPATGTQLHVDRPAAPRPAAGSDLLYSFQRRPLTFVTNSGRYPDEVAYVAEVGGASFFFTQDRIVLATRDHSVFLDFIAKAASANLRVGDPKVTRLHDLRGDRQGGEPVRPHGRLVYEGLYPNIDLVLEGREEALKSTYHLRPGAKPSDLRLRYSGIDRLSVDEAGQLVIHIGQATLVDSAPVAYQTIEGASREVPIRYELIDERTYGFTLGDYDPRYPLVIDPELAYSTGCSTS